MAKEMLIEKSVIINKDVHEVFSFLQETKNQDKFSVWNMKDPTMKKTYTGIDGTKGFTYTWDSKDKNTGAGKQEITDIMEDTFIRYHIRFERPMKNEATTEFRVDKVREDQTSVTWSFAGPVKFPMSLLSFLFKGMLGKQIEKSLQNLKALLEKR